MQAQLCCVVPDKGPLDGCCWHSCFMLLLEHTLTDIRHYIYDIYDALSLNVSCVGCS